MLIDRIDPNEPYRILIDNRNPLRLVLASRTMLQHGGPVEPLWHREAADARSFDALVHWVAIRRDRWQEWGQLAECLGRTAFYRHMHWRMEAEALDELAAVRPANGGAGRRRGARAEAKAAPVEA